MIKPHIRVRDGGRGRGLKIRRIPPQKLRGTKQPSATSGEKQMRMLRRLPKLLRYIPGKSQDLR
ncbi:MAG: DUF3479 domain-containing protein, partial [Pseudomonadota bacterium]